ncbi:MAG: hypothetical protein ACXWWC_15430, partial [Chitinophagaceae bacterium]
KTVIPQKSFKLSYQENRFLHIMGYNPVQIKVTKVYKVNKIVKEVGLRQAKDLGFLYTVLSIPFARPIFIIIKEKAAPEKFNQMQHPIF